MRSDPYQPDFGEVEWSFNILSLKKDEIVMDEKERKVFEEFIDKHKDKIKSIDAESIAKDDEEKKWLQIYRLFSDETKDNFRNNVQVKKIRQS